MNLMYIKENKFWSNVHKDWNMYDVNENIYYRIVNFENLDEKYQKMLKIYGIRMVIMLMS